MTQRQRVLTAQSLEGTNKLAEEAPSESVSKGADASQSRVGHRLSEQTKALPISHNDTSTPVGFRTGYGTLAYEIEVIGPAL